MTCNCPLCGQDTSGKLSWNKEARAFEANGELAVFTEFQARIFDLIWRRKVVHDRADLAEFAYSGDKSGGADTLTTMSIMLGRIRKRMKPTGYTITKNEGRPKMGWRIVKIAEAA